MILNTPRKYTHERIKTAHKRTFSDIDPNAKKADITEPEKKTAVEEVDKENDQEVI